MPVLQDAGRVVQGSSPIIDYVDEHSPEPPLTPADPSERQRSLELERWLDCELGERVRRVFYSTHSTIVIWSSAYSPKADLGGAG